MHDDLTRTDVAPLDQDERELDLGIEELEDVVSPDFGDFATGFGTGVALVGLGVAAAT